MMCYYLNVHFQGQRVKAKHTVISPHSLRIVLSLEPGMVKNVSVTALNMTHIGHTLYLVTLLS